MHRRLTVWGASAGLALLAPFSLRAQAMDVLTRAAATITADSVLHHIRVIAHDSMAGRATPSPGLEKTARYVADQFRTFGLTPGGDRGSWLLRTPTSDSLGPPNTIGLLEGSDPKLKHEYLVIVAHMDHIGTGRGNGLEQWRGGAPQPVDDSIYNGADDNASGTAGLIELARAFSRPGVRPRRSLIFLGVSGEEGGPSGSQYFLKQPPVPVEQLVAAFNMDMIGRLQQQNTVFIKGGQYSDLLGTVGRVVPAHPELRLSVVLRTDMTEGSDHINFAQRKIPILFFYDGGAEELAHPDYHRVTDTPERITADATANALRFIFYVGQEVANADQRPKWNETNWQNRAQNPDGNQVP